MTRTDFYQGLKISISPTHPNNMDGDTSGDASAAAAHSQRPSDRANLSVDSGREATDGLIDPSDGKKGEMAARHPPLLMGASLPRS